MEKLPMCRICLVEDVRMYVVVNKEMRELYEKLSNNPFITTDHRPMLACSFCCTKLKQFCRFQRQFRHAEELFACMLNESCEVRSINQTNLPWRAQLPNTSANLNYSEFFSGFIKTPVHQISIVENQNISDAVKEELPEICETILDDIVELKEEFPSEMEPEIVDKRYLDVEYKPELQFQSEDDAIFLGSQIKVEEDLQISRKKRRAGTKRPPVAKKSKPQRQKVKQKGVTSEEHKKYEQSESKVKEPPTNTSCEVKNSSSVNTISIDNNGDNDNEDKSKRLRVKENPYKCDICQRGFNQKYHLTRHILVHAAKKTFECDKCQSVFFTREDLLCRHMTSHNSEKPFECEICKRRFSKNNNLKRHTLIHTGEKPYKCELCQYSCNQKADLKKHIRIHTDEKPYKCDLCQQSCSQKIVLKKHIIRKHLPRKIPLK